MIVYSGNIYLEKEHIELLKTEPEYGDLLPALKGGAS
jgi:hypothetical protein